MASTARRRATLADEHDACVEALFTHYRASGFPVYDLSPRERAEQRGEGWRRRLDSKGCDRMT